MRDYEQWHQAYDDPESGLSWRLARVRAHLADALDWYAGPVRLISGCAGDGRDVISVLAGRPDAERVQATLVELHPGIADRARASASAAGLTTVDVRTADAGLTDAYAGVVPAQVVVVVGIFGNISDADVERTVRATPQLCAPGATVLWSRACHPDDNRNDQIRSWFDETGFVELEYATSGADDGPALGVVRFTGEPEPLVTGSRLFTFIR